MYKKSQPTFHRSKRTQAETGFTLLRFPVEIVPWKFTLYRNLFSGHLDRLGFVGATVVSLIFLPYGGLRELPFALLGVWLFAPLIQITTLFLEEGVPPSFRIRLTIIPAFYIPDIFSAGSALVDPVIGRAQTWKKIVRIPSR